MNAFDSLYRNGTRPIQRSLKIKHDRPSLFRILVLGTTVLGLPIVAQEPMPDVDLQDLNLQYALALAEEINPTLREANARVEAASGRVKQAGLFPNPFGIAGVENAPFEGSTSDEAQYLAGFSQPIPLGGRLSKARRVEQLEKDRLSKAVELTRRNVKTRVRQTFADALYREEVVRTQGEILSNANQGFQTIKARFDAGDATQEELARSQLELIRIQKTHREAVADSKQARVALATAIGDADRRISSVSGTLADLLELPDLNEILNGLGTHPTLAMSEASIASATARVDLAKAQRLPNLNFELVYRRIESENVDAFDAGIRIPIPFFNRNQGRLQEATANRVAAEAQAIAARNTLIETAKQRHTQLAVALQNTRVFQEQALPQANIMLELAESRFLQGDASLPEILPIRREWADVNLTYLEGLNEAVVAWANLVPLLGDD